MSGAPVVPPLLVLAIAAGTAWFIDDIIGPSTATRRSVLWGIGVSGLGLAMAAAGVVEFRKVQTTVDPIRPERASALVVSGTYRITRNPMYVGFVLILMGWVLALASPAGFAVAGAFVLYLNRFQIPPEEAALGMRFGEAFSSYQSQVRRWL